MSATLSTITRPAVAARPGSIFRLLNACRGVIARALADRAAIAHLRELDDGALRDIGLSRFQIEAAVHGVLVTPDRATN